MKSQKSFLNNVPTLYLVATPIGNLKEMTPRAVEILKEVDVIAAEDTRNTMGLLKHFEINTKLIAHHMYNEKQSSDGLIEMLNNGMNIALVSDAGYPLISDPGQVLVNRVIDAGYNVVTINGPSAILAALCASGIAAQPFTFVGFLGSSEKECKKQLEKWKNHEETLIFYESPHRIEKTLKYCLTVLGDRRMCLARELTKKYEEYLRGTISEVLEVVKECKGEMVIIMEGCKQEEQPTLSMPDLLKIVDRYVEAGMSAKDAIKKTAQEYGVSKNEIYRNYVS
ncbi:MAG: 16S rRNA (cytidine(1402)-2'-O)-methyltransferase [Erysipelotrichaceae bacterium]|nr:16S rRNA (cytidine(1402)-2'-O)-methyltransferase [Erysipelotrichaceae bacterium]